MMDPQEGLMTEDIAPSRIAKNSLLLSILRHSHEEMAEINEVAQDSRLSADDVGLIIKNLEKGQLISIEKSGGILADTTQRLRIAFELVKTGSDIERIFKYLSWQEFEEASARILEESGYAVHRRVRFRNEARKFEIDLLGLRQPLILCLDCKHWMRGSQRSPLKKAIGEQVIRVEGFAHFVRANRERFHMETWKKAKLLPVMIVLLDVPLQVYEGVPAVPILRLGNFLYELPAALDILNSTDVELPNCI